MPSVKATAVLARELDKIAATWVKDPFRPHIQLQSFLQSLATHPKLTDRTVQATRALRDNDMYNKVCFSREPSAQY